MSTLRNRVQLIGNVGNEPETTTFESGKKITRFSLATNEFYRKDGERIQQTTWHNIVAWGKVAEIIEQYVSKGKELAIEGSLNTRSYEDNQGERKFVTEVVAHEILLLGTKNGNNSAGN